MRNMSPFDQVKSLKDRLVEHRLKFAASVAYKLYEKGRSQVFSLRGGGGGPYEELTYFLD